MKYNKKINGWIKSKLYTERMSVFKLHFTNLGRITDNN